jgi:hypothetical protein
MWLSATKKQEGLMEYNVIELLSPRIQKYCLPVWRDEHFKHAAHQAMILVEQALKEKGLTIEKHKKFGQALVTSLFRIGGKENSVKLSLNRPYMADTLPTSKS